MATYDAVTARSLLERAIANSAKPALTSEDVDLLMQIAETTDTTGATVYTTASLTTAASVGWRWKAGLVADKYEKLGGGPGVTLERPNWVAYCLEQSSAYSGGGASVDGSGTTASKSGIGSIGIIGSAAADYWETQ